MLVLFSVLLADLVGDVLLLLAFLGQLVVADDVAEGFLRLADHDVLPRRRRLGNFVIAVCHTARLA